MILSIWYSCHVSYSKVNFQYYLYNNNTQLHLDSLSWVPEENEATAGITCVAHGRCVLQASASLMYATPVSKLEHFQAKDQCLTHSRYLRKYLLFDQKDIWPMQRVGCDYRNPSCLSRLLVVTLFLRCKHDNASFSQRHQKEPYIFTQNSVLLPSAFNNQETEVTKQVNRCF